MDIIIGKTAGFCDGVEYTVKKAKELLEKNGEIYCLGDIVHNDQVIEKLQKLGMKTIYTIEDVPDGSNVIFRAHGEPKITYERANEKNLHIYDLTCVIVESIHEKIRQNIDDSFIIIVGNKEHPEIIGSLGFAGENACVVQSEDDILDAYMKFEKTKLDKIFVVAQTTFSSKKFDDLALEIEKNFCKVDNIEIDKTICDSTENRQLEARKLSQNCDVMLIIGGEKSSNTRKLYEISQENCKRVLYIQTVSDLEKVEFDRECKIGIMAGASTPKEIIEEIKDYLERKYM